MLTLPSPDTRDLPADQPARGGQVGQAPAAAANGRTQPRSASIPPPFTASAPVANRHKIAIGLTGEPVPVGRRSGAMMHMNDQRQAAAHASASSVNCK